MKPRFIVIGIVFSLTICSYGWAQNGLPTDCQQLLAPGRIPLASLTKRHLECMILLRLDANPPQLESLADLVTIDAASLANDISYDSGTNQFRWSPVPIRQQPLSRREQQVVRDGLRSLFGDALQQADKLSTPDFNRLTQNTFFGVEESGPERLPTVSLQADRNTIPIDGGSTQVSVSMSRASNTDMTVSLGFSGTAQEGRDYRASSREIVIAAGQLRGSVTLISVSGSATRPGMTVIVEILEVSGGIVAEPQRTTLTIGRTRRERVVEDETLAPPPVTHLDCPGYGVTICDCTPMIFHGCCGRRRHRRHSFCCPSACIVVADCFGCSPVCGGRSPGHFGLTGIDTHSLGGSNTALKVAVNSVGNGRLVNQSFASKSVSLNKPVKRKVNFAHLSSLKSLPLKERRKLAAHHFGEGCYSFWSRDYDEAEQSFSAALMLDIDCLNAWAFKTFVAIERAQESEAARAAAQVHRLLSENAAQRRQMYEAISRVQGNSRLMFEDLIQNVSADSSEFVAAK
jgi:hypothetical protein